MSSYQFLADAVLSLHVLFVLVVVLAVPLILYGGFRGWAWVRNFWLRLGHLVGIGVVVAQAWTGVVCPLTTLEMWLRRQAGGGVYEGNFVQYWLQSLLYFDAPQWVFVLVYSLFGALVVTTWYFVRPRKKETATNPACT